MLLQAVIGAGLQPILDADVLAVLLEESAFELGPVVHDDAAWDGKSAHNALEECDC